MQSLYPEAGRDRELHEIADEDVSPIKREAIYPGARDASENGAVPGRKYRTAAVVEMENNSAGQPVAQLDIEVEFGRAQSQVFPGGAVEVVCARGYPFDDTAKGKEAVDLRARLLERVADNLSCCVLLCRPSDLQICRRAASGRFVPAFSTDPERAARRPMPSTVGADFVAVAAGIAAVKGGVAATVAAAGRSCAAAGALCRPRRSALQAHRDAGKACGSLLSAPRACVAENCDFVVLRSGGRRRDKQGEAKQCSASR